LANCTASDVRLVINTGLTDDEIAALIALADTEVEARGFISPKWTAGLKKRLSMLLTAELVSMNDVMSRGINEYQAVKPGNASLWRQMAEKLVASVQGPYVKATSYREIDEE